MRSVVFLGFPAKILRISFHLFLSNMFFFFLEVKMESWSWKELTKSDLPREEIHPCISCHLGKGQEQYISPFLENGGGL